MGSLSGLKSINIELTSRCSKSCWMCGRRKLEREHPELCNWGDMPLDMLERIAGQIPRGVFVQLHMNGEPLLYPHINAAFSLFCKHYVGFDTNGKLLMKYNEIIRATMTSVTISVIPDDPDEDEQLDIAQQFVEIERRPLVVFRLLGHIDESRELLIRKWAHMYPKVLIAKRVLHSPDGSFDYCKQPVIPEHGICEEMLHKLAIDRFGNVYPCVRFDPHKKNWIGNIDDTKLYGMECIPEALNLGHFWDSYTRKAWVRSHIAGRRDLVPLCKTCDYYGIPRG